MNKILLTVVTTTYNHEKYIEECIKSIVAQKTNFNFKLLISDDNSTDKTPKIIEKYRKRYPNLINVIYRKKNLGAAENFVETLNTVHSKYVALCDGDDYWSDVNKLQKQIDFLEKNLDYSICFHQTLIFFEDESQEARLHPLNINDLINENFIPSNSVVYRWKYIKSDSLKKDFSSTIVPGDYFLHLMHTMDGKIYYINEPMSCYRKQTNGIWYSFFKNNKKNKFYAIYGEKYLNFYLLAEKKLNIENCFKKQKEEAIKNILISYIKLRQKNKLEKLYKKNYKNYSLIFKNTINNLNIIDKLYYLCVTNKIKE